MFLLSFARIIKFSFQDISRNIWLSIVTITILILALFTINMLLVVKVVEQSAISAIEEKMDISLYLNPNSKENEIIALKTKINSLEEVKNISYISKTDALAYFIEKNKNKSEILEALKELKENPLSASLRIEPKKVEMATSLINKIDKIDDELIESHTFSDHKIILNKINSITKKVSKIGLFISIIFILITLLVIYNSIKIAIYTHKKEIGIMRLVGASNIFIYMPFLLSNIIYAFAGILAILIIFYPFLSILQPYLETFFVGHNVNLISYFNDNFLYIFGTQFLAITTITMLASLIAIRKYTKI